MPDVVRLLQDLQGAVAEMKATQAAAEQTHALNASKVDAAKAAYDAVVEAARAANDASYQAYEDASVAVQRLQAEVRELIGDLMPAGQSRIYQS